MDKSVPKPEIVNIFKKMEYGQVQGSTLAAKNWLKNHSLGPFIDGTSKGVTADYYEVMDFITNEPLANIGKSSHIEIEKALMSCQKAAEAWSKLTGHDRARHLYSLARHIQKHATLVAQMETLNRCVQNRDPKEFDIPGIVRCFYHYAGWAQLSDTLEFKDWKPVGIVTTVTSSTSPLLLTALMIGPALAAGNTVCLKPSYRTPLPSLLIAHIAAEAGLPPGVLNVLPGDSEVAVELVTHELISKVVFMGSNQVGRLIREKTAGFGKSLTMLLTGSKSTMVVLDSADMDSAVDAVVDAAWFNQGQVPWSLGRLLVQESIWHTFIKQLCRRIDKIIIGPASDSMADVGASVVINLSKKIAALVSKAEMNGLKVYQKTVPEQHSEHYFPPTLIIGGNVEGNCVIEDDDPLPVVTALPFRTAKEAITLANNTRYGICASVWTEVLSLAIDMANRLEFGTVWINSHGIYDAAVPFGGWKQSGIGVFAAKEGLFEFLQPCEMHNSPAHTAENSEFNLESPCTQVTNAQQTDIPSCPEVDITYKLFYGGAQKRPDSNSSYAVNDINGHFFAFVANGNGKDVRNAVEAAVKTQEAWSKISAHARAQILYNAAEKLCLRKEDFLQHLSKLYGEKNKEVARKEVETCIKLLFHWAACCDKKQFPKGDVEPGGGMIVHMVHKPRGVIAVIQTTNEASCNPKALLNFVALILPAISYGNTVVALPNSSYPTPALLFCEVLATSDCPNGVVNVITGMHETLTLVLAAHQEVSAVWAPGVKENAAKVIERASKGNLKHIWTNKLSPASMDWSEKISFFELQATKCKSIWLPSGDIFAN